MNLKDISGIGNINASLIDLVNKMQKDLKDNLVNLPEGERKNFEFDFANLKKEAEEKSKDLIANCELLKTKLRTV